MSKGLDDKALLEELTKDQSKITQSIKLSFKEPKVVKTELKARFNFLGPEYEKWLSVAKEFAGKPDLRHAYIEMVLEAPEPALNEFKPLAKELEDFIAERETPQRLTLTVEGN